MAAPGIDDSRVRRSELPMRVAEAGLERADGEPLAVVRASSPMASTVGRWMTSMRMCLVILVGGRGRSMDYLE